MTMQPTPWRNATICDPLDENATGCKNGGLKMQRYELVIEPTEGHAVTFWHENYNVRNKITRVGRTGQLLTGVINFGNDIP